MVDKKNKNALIVIGVVVALLFFLSGPSSFLGSTIKLTDEAPTEVPGEIFIPPSQKVVSREQTLTFATVISQGSMPSNFISCNDYEGFTKFTKDFNTVTTVSVGNSCSSNAQIELYKCLDGSICNNIEHETTGYKIGGVSPKFNNFETGFYYAYTCQGCSTSAEACQDTDGGLTYNTKGTVTKGSTSLTDYCHTSTDLTEYQCVDGFTSKKQTFCEGQNSNWAKCVDGACVECTVSSDCQNFNDKCENNKCVQIDLTCTDSDGDNPLVKGTVTFGGQTYTDQCVSGFLIEQVCNPTRSAKPALDCRSVKELGICSDGACVTNAPDDPLTCLDTDKDGYGELGSSACQYPGKDCNDFDAAINPGKSEIPGNDVDENCDGSILACTDDSHCSSDKKCVNQQCIVPVVIPEGEVCCKGTTGLIGFLPPTECDDSFIGRTQVSASLCIEKIEQEQTTTTFSGECKEELKTGVLGFFEFIPQGCSRAFTKEEFKELSSNELKQSICSVSDNCIPREDYDVRCVNAKTAGSNVHESILSGGFLSPITKANVCLAEKSFIDQLKDILGTDDDLVVFGVLAVGALLVIGLLGTVLKN